MLLGSSILDFALGMIFFYFLLSTLCSTLNELIASLLDWRAQELVKGIRDLLNLPLAEGTATLPADRPTTEDARSKASPRTLGDAVFEHPLIKGLATEPYGLRQFLVRRQEHPPSYIPDHTFALAVLDILATTPSANAASASTGVDARFGRVRENVAALPTDLRQVLTPLIGAVDTLDQARANLEDWYNVKMDRVSGAYKRWIQFVLLILAVLTSVVLNADSLTVGRALWQSPTLRQVLVAQVDETLVEGQGAAPAPEAAPDSAAQTIEQIQAVQGQVQEILSFPVWWGPLCTSNATTGQATTSITDPPNCTPQASDAWGWIQKGIGLLATTLAVSLGAPFWFDLLRRVANVRNSGPAPKEERSETSSGRQRGAHS